MPPRRAPTNNEEMDANAMTQAMTDMATAMTQQAAIANQQAAAKEQRDLHKQQQKDENAAFKRLTKFQKQNPPKFQGEVDPEKADFWIQELEKMFAISKTQAEDKVEYAAYMLTGDAEYWWKSARAIMIAAEEEVTWESFRRKFLDKYFPQTTRDQLESDFLNLKQGSMIIGAYAAKMESMSRYFRFFQNGMDEEYMCRRFQDGLKDDIQESVVPLGIKNFQLLVEKCREVEIMKNRHQAQKNKGSSGNGNGGPVRNHQNQGRGKHPQERPYHRPHGNDEEYRPMIQNSGPRGDQDKREDVICFRCGEVGHYADKCTGEKKNLCYNCKKPGHQARSCTAPKVEPTVNAARARRPTTVGRVFCIQGAGN